MKYRNLETADARNTAIYRIARFSDVTGTAIDQVDSELIKTERGGKNINGMRSELNFLRVSNDLATVAAETTI